MIRRSELVAAALVGTDRAPLAGAPPTATTLGTLLAQLEDQSPERRLLASAAIVVLWEQVGAEPRLSPGILPSPAPTDDLIPIPPRAAQHLGEMIHGDFGAVLPEWLAAVRVMGHALPYRWLPEMLDLARQKRHLRPLIMSVLGGRGRWLAAQNPEWRDLVTPFDSAIAEEVWETGTREARLAVLEHLDATDSARARELLIATWTEEPAADRAAFIGVLAVGLSAADEPFLEDALDDRSKQVRAVAADLLARLPGSRLVERMEARLRPLLTLERGRLGRAKLHVTLPQSCDAALARDGVESRPPGGLGKRAWWLLQMLAAVPPAAWSEKWGKSPEEAIRLAGGTEYETVLLEGWARAAVRHDDGAWAEALLRRWADAPWSLTGSSRSLHIPEDLERLLRCVPQGRLEGWLAALMRIAGDDDTLLALVAHHRRAWTEPFTRAVLDLLRVMARKANRTPALGWWAGLPGLALYAAPSLAREAEQGWPGDTPWERSLEQFLATLRFRQEMLDALCLSRDDLVLLQSVYA